MKVNQGRERSNSPDCIYLATLIMASNYKLKKQFSKSIAQAILDYEDPRISNLPCLHKETHREFQKCYLELHLQRVINSNIDQILDYCMK